MKSLDFIDDFLNTITMYRLVLYYLIVLVLLTAFLSFFGFIPYSPSNILASAIFLIIAAWVTNRIFANIFKLATNVESFYISALILALIVAPFQNPNDLLLLGLVAVLAMSSKYVLAISKKHIFNPAAISVVILALVSGQTANWWVGNPAMTPFIVIGGFLIVRKIRREAMVYTFFLAALITQLSLALLYKTDLLLTLNQLLFNSYLFFLGFVMLTEPSTTPPSKALQLIYAVIVGVNIYSTPELALIFGNVFSYLVSPKYKLILKLKQKLKLSANTYEFIFTNYEKFNFKPGQYLEWTLGHASPDNRGNRRYFTIASSPTEPDIRIGIKFYENSSSFKRKLFNLDKKTPVVASQLSGDFVMPENDREKLVFMAGGIGITPFRSMLKYLLDSNKKRDIILIYSNKLESEIVYKDILNKAQKLLGIKIIYILTELTGRVNADIIRKYVPDYRQRKFYLSGPHSMVTGFENTLKQMGVSGTKIIIDFFPGYA